MKKKLGPLETWQWLAIGAAVGVIYYLYKVRQANTHASTGQAPTPGPATDLGPIDPTTGAPFALEGAYQQGAGSAATGNNNAAQNAGPTTLQQELSDLGSIETLISGLNQALPAPTTTSSPDSAAGATGTANVNGTMGTGPAPTPATITTHRGGPFYNYYVKATGHPPPSTVPVSNVVYKMWQNGVKAVTGGARVASNPGHIVTTHPGGKQTVTSSAPHNKQQHKNIAPPQHQRANPTSHPSTPKPKPPPKPKPKPPAKHR